MTEYTKEEEAELRSKLNDRLFERRATDPSGWLSIGDSLKRAADLIRTAHLSDIGIRHVAGDMPEVDVSVRLRFSEMLPIYMLLSGMAIEDYAKGIILQIESGIVSDGKLANWGSNGHDCQQLVRRAKLKCTPEEEDILRRLKEYVVWQGRYPVRKSSLAKGHPLGIGSRLPADFNCIDSLCSKLRAELSLLAAAEEKSVAAIESDIL